MLATSFTRTRMIRKSSDLIILVLVKDVANIKVHPAKVSVLILEREVIDHLARLWIAQTQTVPRITFSLDREALIRLDVGDRHLGITDGVIGVLIVVPKKGFIPAHGGQHYLGRAIIVRPSGQYLLTQAIRI